jgi:hypothetical protein
MRKLAMSFGLAVVFLCGGCNLLGLLASETIHEEKVTAQFKLSEYGKEGVLVFVDSLKKINVAYGLEEKLEGSIENYLVKKVRLKKENILGGDELSELRSSRPDFDRMSPVMVGEALGVGKVLYVRIENYSLFNIDGKDYYEGFLVTRSVLFDVGTGAVVWPDTMTGKVIRVKVDLETKGREAALARLTTATAHCITRYFYNCPRDQFKISEEHVIYEMEDW